MRRRERHYGRRKRRREDTLRRCDSWRDTGIRGSSKTRDLSLVSALNKPPELASPAGPVDRSSLSNTGLTEATGQSWDCRESVRLQKSKLQ